MTTCNKALSDVHRDDGRVEGSFGNGAPVLIITDSYLNGCQAELICFRRRKDDAFVCGVFVNYQERESNNPFSSLSATPIILVDTPPWRDEKMDRKDSLLFLAHPPSKNRALTKLFTNSQYARVGGSSIETS